MERRDLLKTVGGIGLAAAAGGAGLVVNSQLGAAANVQVQTNDTQIANDRGDLSLVTVDPELEISWANFDESVGEMSISVLAQTEEMESFKPVFRTAPWLIPDSANGNYDQPARINGWRPGANPPLTYTKPGTTGSLTFNEPLSVVLEESAESRGETTPLENGAVTVVSDDAPDYQSYVDSEDVAQNLLDQYLSGNSIGGTPQKLSEAGASLENGTYGAVDTTGTFDVPTDGTTESFGVTLEYQVMLRRPGLAQLYGMTPNLTYGEYVGVYDGSGTSGGPARIGSVSSYGELESAIRDDLEEQVDFGTGWLENVRVGDIAIVPEIVSSPTPPEVQSFDQTQLLLPMSDEEQYPSLSTNELPPTTRDFGSVRRVGQNGHPAVQIDQPSFSVSVTNEAGQTNATGSTSNSGAKGAGQ